MFLIEEKKNLLPFLKPLPPSDHTPGTENRIVCIVLKFEDFYNYNIYNVIWEMVMLSKCTKIIDIVTIICNFM